MGKTEFIFPTHIWIEDNILNNSTLKSLQDKSRQEVFYENKNSYLSDASMKQSFLIDQNTLSNKVIKSAKKYALNMGHEIEDLQICNSWLTRTKPTGFSQFHDHRNSYLSAVFYLQNGSALSIKNPYYDSWFMQPVIKPHKNLNMHTYQYLNFEAKKNRLYIFPSFLEHRITPNETKENRYSVACNIIPKGSFGDQTQRLNL